MDEEFEQPTETAQNNRVEEMNRTSVEEMNRTIFAIQTASDVKFINSLEEFWEFVGQVKEELRG